MFNLYKCRPVNACFAKNVLGETKVSFQFQPIILRSYSYSSSHLTWKPVKSASFHGTRAQSSVVTQANIAEGNGERNGEGNGTNATSKICPVDHDVSYADARDASEIPGLPSIPIFGSMLSFAPFGDLNMAKRIEMSKILYKRYGPILQMRLPVFPGRTVFLFDPADMEKVFRADGDLPMRNPATNTNPFVYYRNKAGISLGLFSTNFEEWWDLRKVVNKPMTRARAAHAYLHLQDPVSEDLVARIRATRDPNTLEVRDDFINELYKYALESVLAISFGKRIFLLKSDLDSSDKSQAFVDNVQAIFEEMNKMVVSLPLWAIGIKSKAYKKFELANDGIVSFLMENIKEAHEQGFSKDSKTFFGTLMQSDLSEKDKAVVINDMLIAGVDTTGSTLGFLLYSLATNQEVQQRLYEEIIENFPDPTVPIAPNKFEYMPFLHAVAKENFRKYPVAPAHVRTNQVDLVIKGYQIPKGTTILMEWGGTANSSDTFPEPEKFLPSRWLRGTKEGHRQKTEAQDSGIHPHTVQPFGVGRRMCVGRRFADQEVHLALARILQHFKIEYHHEEIGIASRLISLPDKPLKIKFIDRHSS